MLAVVNFFDVTKIDDFFVHLYVEIILKKLTWICKIRTYCNRNHKKNIFKERVVNSKKRKNMNEISTSISNRKTIDDLNENNFKGMIEAEARNK